MKSSEQLDQLATALAKAQASFSVARKEHEASVKMRDGGSYGYSYADLPIVVAACRKALTDNGIAVVQSASATERVVSVATRLIHASGQWLSDEDAPLTMTAADASPQRIGSAITYARRYALMAMVGVVASDEDDDGAAASRDWTPPAQSQRPPQQQERRPPPNAPTEQDIEAVMADIALAKTREELNKVLPAAQRIAGNDPNHRLRIAFNKRCQELPLPSQQRQRGAA